MSAAERGFVRLADALHRSAVAPAPLVEPADLVAPPPPAEPALSAVAPESFAAVRSARLFGAAVGDAVDATVAELLRRIAVDVLARDLRLGPVETAAIVERIVRERLTDDALRVRVAPADLERCAGLPCVADPELAPGDALVTCRGGAIDARLGVRLAIVLAAFGA